MKNLIMTGRIMLAAAILALWAGEVSAQAIELSLERGPNYTFQQPQLFGNITMTPHMAAWLEDKSGTFIKTIFVSLKGGRQDFWVGSRPNPLPVWEKKHGQEAVSDVVGSASPAPRAPVPLSWTASVSPALLASGFKVWVEANIGFDYNNTWPNANGDVWGQPSILWSADIPPGTKPGSTIPLMPAGVSTGNSGTWITRLDGITTARTLLSRANIIIQEAKK